MIERFVPKEQNGVFNYAVFTPEKDFENKPLLVYLHGAGERGENFSHVFRNAVPRLIAAGKEYPAAVLVPQCPADCVWDNITRELYSVINHVADEFGCDRERISITGSSMGGFGCFAAAMAYPNLFSAAGAVAGGGMSWRAKKLCGLPVIIIHGEEDPAVPIIYSRLMFDSIKACGGSAEFISYPKLGHGDAIERAYEDDYLTDKLLSARRTDFAPVPEVMSELF